MLESLFMTDGLRKQMDNKITVVGDHITPKVSVCIVTYNQEKYIRECLSSIFRQTTNFDFEVIVGDDCSTDSTRSIVQEFANLYPNKLKVLLHTKNVGAVENYFATHELAQGKYIAHMDGDDYALPGKLQKQADFLDEHVIFNIVWHRVNYQFVNGRQAPDLIRYEKIREGYSKSDLIKFTFLANHSTKMYRATQRQFCGRSKTTLDYLLNIQHLQNGRAAYVSQEILGVYRYGLGISSDSNLKFRKYLIDGLLNISKQGIDERIAVNCAAFALMLADIKNLNNTLIMISRLWINTISLRAVFKYLGFIQQRRMYVVPKK